MSCHKNCTRFVSHINMWIVPTYCSGNGSSKNNVGRSIQVFDNVRGGACCNPKEQASGKKPSIARKRLLRKKAILELFPEDKSNKINWVIIGRAN